MAKQEFKLNPNIVNSPVVLFVGAGASTPLGLKTTDGVIDKLPTWLATRIAENDNTSFAANDLQTQLKPIYKASAKYYELSKSDVETVLDYLEELSGAISEVEKLPRFLYDLAGTRDMQGQVGAFDTKGLRKLREYIIQEVISHYSHVAPGAAFNNYGWLLEFLTSSPHFHGVLPVFTTNYDWVFERLAQKGFQNRYSFEDGFGGRDIGDFNANNFKNVTSVSSKPCLSLFKLHGSTCWRWRQPPDEGVYKVLELEEAFSSSRYTAIWPTLKSKADTLKNHPYNVLFGYFEKTLKKRKPCLAIFIGFSFRDDVINKIIREALKENRHLGICVFDLNLNTSGELSDSYLLDTFGLIDKDHSTRLFSHKVEFGDKAQNRAIELNVQNAIEKVFNQ